MIISPPFLPLRTAGTSEADYVASGMPVATINCPGTSTPEGSFPVSLKCGWHGGVHIHAPAVGAVALPVRAIADGEIVFARKPTVAVTDPAHPQNYNPYGKDPAWTDNGMVILRHTTDIGEGGNAESIVFYSIIMHLSELRGTALKIANGVAPPSQRKIFRKQELGSAGRIYGVPGHIHLEVICDDENCRRLVGRVTGSVDLTGDGRSDAIYGEMYFHLPSGTKFYSAICKESEPSTPPTYVTEAPLIVGMRHANGDGPVDHRGDDYFTTYDLDGRIVGEVEVDSKAEYLAYSRTLQIAAGFAEGSRPAPSAVYELPRFGRLINVDNERLAPIECPHWRMVSYANGKGWVNLNGKGVTKFSDADFPQWRGWSLIDDDVDGDSRANSTILDQIIGVSRNSADQLTSDELERCLNLQEVKDRLRRVICKLPSEWNNDTIDTRWGWLQTSRDHQLTGDDWKNFKAHVEALGLSSVSLPQPLREAHWHFHPAEFISHFRKCLWLSVDELKQIVPRQTLRKSGNTTVWEAVQPNLSNPTSVLRTQRSALNRSARKYGISSSLRLASFYGNAVQETQWLGRLSEAGGGALWYAPWYGRGFLQLTHPTNYFDYWRYRGRQIPDSLRTALANAMSNIAAQPVAQRSNAALQDHLFPQLTQQMRGWRDEVGGVATNGSNDACYAPADTAGFYWAKLAMASYADADHVLQRVLVTTNQGPKVYYRSPSFWRASAAVNLPGVINALYAQQLNGFDARCVAYGYALAVLTEIIFPNSNGAPSAEFPEGYMPRRE